MQVFQATQKHRGFTFIELMLVVTIIGILAAIAIPKFLTYQCKTKQVEARKGLGALAKMQATYFAENEEYAADIDVLGFSMLASEGGYYTYSILASERFEWKAEARGVENLFPTEEVWTMNQSLRLVHVANGCEED